MGRTRTQLRQLVAQQFPPGLVAGTATSATSTTLTNLDELGRYDDNHFIGAYIYIIGAGVPVRRITDSDQSTGFVTFIPNEGTGITTNAYDISPFPGDMIHEAIDDALGEAYELGMIGRPLWLNHWVVDSPIYNSTFDYWDATATIDGWTATTLTLTRHQHTSSSVTVLPGESVAELSAAAGTLTLDRQYRRFLSDSRGHSLTLYAWMWSDTASITRAQLLADGSVVGSTDYHAGNSTWSMLSVEVTPGDTTTELTVQFDRASGAGVSYVGAIWLTGGPSLREYPIPLGLMPNGPGEIYQAPVNQDTTSLVADVRGRISGVPPWTFYKYRDEQADTDTGVLAFLDKRPVRGYRLWMPGRAPLTLPTADGNNIEINQPEDLLIAKMAARRLIEQDLNQSTPAERASQEPVLFRLGSDILALSNSLSTNKIALPLMPKW